LDDQRDETFYLRKLQVYTDFLYQGHFLLSSIMGCHPPLVGHSVFLRSDAIRQVGRIRNLRSAQKWLNNIGLPFLGVDQIGFRQVTNSNRTEYWSETHVSCQDMWFARSKLNWKRTNRENDVLFCSRRCRRTLSS
jgi:hypothetical protein